MTMEQITPETAMLIISPAASNPPADVYLKFVFPAQAAMLGQFLESDGAPPPSLMNSQRA
jgi:hypothetical protein